MNNIKYKGSFFERIFELFTDTLCTVLITIGATVMLNTLFSVRMSFLEIVSYCAIVGFVLLIISRKIIITTAVLAAILIFGGIYLAAQKSFSLFLNSVLNYFKWLFVDGTDTSSELYFSRAFIVSYFLVISLVAILVFLVIRKLKRSWVLFISVCIILPLVTDLSAVNEGILGTLLIFLGFLPNIAKDYYSKKKQFSKKERVEPITPRSLVTLTAVALCIVVALGVLFVLPNNVTNWRTRLCSDAIVDIQSKSGFYTKAIRELDSVSLVDLGLQSEENNISDDSSANGEGNVLATIKDDRSRLLKVATYEHFNGSKWNNYESTDYFRINGPFDSNFDKYFSSRGYTLVGGESSLDRLVPSKSITVTLREPTKTLYTLSQCINFKELTPTKNPVIFNDRAELINLYGVGEGYSYSVDFYEFPMTTTAFQNNSNFKEYLYKLTNADDEIYDNAEFYNKYTQLPKYWSKILNQESQIITKDAKNLYEAALLLSNIFTEDGGYTFTKMPEKADKKYSLVDSLLATKKGSSLHYATAMCMMARNIGIPSRLVIGYKTVKGDNDQEWLVKDNEGYVWAECFFSNIGWAPFDAVPTESTNINPNEEGSKEQPDYVQGEEFLQPEIPDEEDEDEEETPEEPESREFKVPYFLFIILFILLLIYIRSKVSQSYYKYEKVIKRFKDTRLAAEFYYKDLLRQMKHLEIYYKNSNSLTETYELLPKYLLDDETKKAFEIYNAVHYGDYNPTQDDIYLLFTVRQKFENNLEKKMNKYKYRLFRKILLPYFLNK